MRIFFIIFISSLLVLFGLQYLLGQKTKIIIATGSPEGFYYRMASSIKEVLESSGEYNVKLLYTKGSANNIDLIARGEADLAVIQGDITSIDGNVAALSHVRSLMPLFSEVLHVIVRKDAGISSFEQVVNSRVCIGGKGSGMNLTNRRVLFHFNKNIDESLLCELPFSDTINALKKGDEKAAMFFTGINSSGLERLLSSGQVKYINIDYNQKAGGNIYGIKARYPFYKPYILPKHLYGEYPQTAINTFSAPALLVAKKKLSEGVARDITELIHYNKVRISTTSKLLLAFRDSVDFDTLAVQIHPGALSFFERHRPSVVERYADIATLVVTVVFSFISLYLIAKKYNIGKKRHRLDFFLSESKELYQDYYHQQVNKHYRVNEWLQRVYTLKESTLNALITNKIQEDERYLILQGEINNLMSLAEMRSNKMHALDLRRSARLYGRRK